ncbi:MAG: electron transfer flavoprotein subunit beta/FixA family protein [Candidatus Helarchaeota archaeon]
MLFFVCIKQVPAISEVQIDVKTGLLRREGIPGMINPMDKNAIEVALSLKEKVGGKIIAISMGPPQAENTLREALSMGVDDAYLLTDRAFAGSDTLATSYTLSLGIKKILKEINSQEKYLVICGTQAIDGDTAQVGPEIAEELNIPQITYVQKVELNDNRIIVEKVFRPDEIAIIECKLPALITVLKDINIPRFPTLSGIVDAFDNKKIIHLNASTLGADPSKIGLNGSKTQVWRIFTPQQKGDFIKLSGTLEEVAKQLCQKLKDDKIL